jgi:hypothetical protein
VTRSTSTWKAEPDRGRYQRPGLRPPRGAAEARARSPALDCLGGRQGPLGVAGLRAWRVLARHHPPQALPSSVLTRRSLYRHVAYPGFAEPLRASSRRGISRVASRGHPGVASRRQRHLRRAGRGALPGSRRSRPADRGSRFRPLPRLPCRTARIGFAASSGRSPYRAAGLLVGGAGAHAADKTLQAPLLCCHFAIAVIAGPIALLAEAPEQVLQHLARGITELQMLLEVARCG